MSLPGCLKCPFILRHADRNSFSDQQRFQVLCFNLLIVFQKEVAHSCSSVIKIKNILQKEVTHTVVAALQLK